MSRLLIVSDEHSMSWDLIACLTPRFGPMLPECVDSLSAPARIDRIRPRVVIIDARLQSGSGLQLAAETLRLYEPAIIVVSRDTSLAAKAFDLGVADFVVAPVLPERMQKAMERALGVQAKPPSSQASVAPRTRIRVKCKGSYIFLDAEELVWVEASRSYLNLHCLDRVFRIRESLNDFMRRMASANFLRIHRSTLVNSNYIREVRSWGFGDYAVVLRNSREFSVSRSYRGGVDHWVRNGDVATLPVDVSNTLLSSRSDDSEALLA